MINKKTILGCVTVLLLTACGGGGSEENNSDGGSNGAGDGGGKGNIYSHPVDENGNFNASPTDKVVLADNSVVLEEGQKDGAKLDRENETLTLVGGIGTKYKVGQIIVSDAFDGLLIKVTNVTTDPATKEVIYEYKNTSIEEAFDEFNVSFDDDETAIAFNDVEPIELVSGAVLRRDMTQGDFLNKYIYSETSTPDSTVVPSSSDLIYLPSPMSKAFAFDKVKVAVGAANILGNLFVNFDPNYKLTLNKSKYGVKSLEFKSSVNPLVMYNFDMTFSKEFSEEHSGSFAPKRSEKRIAGWSTKTYYKMVGWVPVSFNFYSDINVESKSSIQGGGVLNARFEHRGKAEINFSGDDGFNASYTKGSIFPSLSVKSLNVSMGHELAVPSITAGIMLYGSVGVHGIIKNQVTQTAELTKSRYNDHVNAFKHEVKGEIVPAIGFRVSDKLKAAYQVTDLWGPSIKHWLANNSDVLADQINNYIFDDKFKYEIFKLSNDIEVPTFKFSATDQDIQVTLDGKSLGSTYGSAITVPNLSVGDHVITVYYRNCLTCTKENPTAPWSYYKAEAIGQNTGFYDIGENNPNPELSSAAILAAKYVGEVRTLILRVEDPITSKGIGVWDQTY